MNISKKKGKKEFLSLLNKKVVIQEFLWNYYIQKINQNNPYEISKFEKKLKRMCDLIKDETLKKYVLESFLDKLNKLTPNQNFKKNYYNFKKGNKKENYQILRETKDLHIKKSHFSEIQIKEFAILFIMFNYLDIVSEKIEDISELSFFSEENENFKKKIIDLLLSGENKETIKSKILDSHNKLMDKILENTSIQIITKSKDNNSILELLNELIEDLKNLNNQKKIESLENELINNLDEHSFSELIKLKSQLNRE